MMMMVLVVMEMRKILIDMERMSMTVIIRILPVVWKRTMLKLNVRMIMVSTIIIIFVEV